MAQIKTMRSSMTLYEWLLLLLLSLVWGGSYFFVGVAVAELPTMTIVFARLSIGAVVLLLCLKPLGIAMPWTRKAWQLFFIMGMLNNAVPFCLIVWGQSHLASGVAAIINASTPMFTILVAHFLTQDESMTKVKFFGVIVGFFGVVVLIGVDSLVMLDGGFWASLACIGAAISYAFAGVFGRKFAREGIAPMATATGQVCASSCILFVIMLLVDTPWQLEVPSMPVFAALVGIGVLSTALAYTVYFRLLATAGATNVLLVTFLVPVNAIILGVAFLNEALLLRHILGMLLIGVSLLVIDGRMVQFLTRRK